MLAEVNKLLHRLGQSRKYLLLLLLRCPFDFCRTLVHARFLENVFSAIQKNNEGKLYLSCSIFMIASVCLFLYNGTIWRLYASYMVKIEGMVRVTIFHKMMKLSMNQLDQKSSGEWLTRLNLDIQMAIKMLAGPITIPHAAVALVNFTFSLVMLSGMSFTLLGISLFFILPHILVSQLVVAKPMTNFKMRSQEAMALVTTYMQTIITNADIILLYDAQGMVLQKFRESSQKLKQENMKIHKQNALGQGLFPLFALTGYLLLLFFGSYLIYSGTMTFGELTAGLQFRGALVACSMMLINCMIQMKIQLAGVLRVNETLEMKGEY